MSFFFVENLCYVLNFIPDILNIRIENSKLVTLKKNRYLHNVSIVKAPCKNRVCSLYP